MKIATALSIVPGLMAFPLHAGCAWIDRVMSRLSGALWHALYDEPDQSCPQGKLLNRIGRTLSTSVAKGEWHE